MPTCTERTRTSDADAVKKMTDTFGRPFALTYINYTCTIYYPSFFLPLSSLFSRRHVLFSPSDLALGTPGRV